MTKRELMIENMFRNYAGCVSAMEKFASQLVDGVTGHAIVQAFEWSEDAINASAKAKVYETILTAVWRKENSEPVSIDAIRSTVMDSILFMSRSPSRSTSVMKNLVAQAMLAAWSEIHQELS